MDDLTCPFCNDNDFDRIGLKLHIQRGWCDAFNETPTSDRPEPEGPLSTDGVPATPPSVPGGTSTVSTPDRDGGMKG